MPTAPDDHLLNTALRDVHATRLHGFALLVALGDRRQAAAAAAQALAAGMLRVHDLRHPERAAAWLRAHVVRSLRRERRIAAPSIGALRSLGVDEALLAGLAGLSIIERAALVAFSVERFAAADVELILDATPSATRRIIASARERYLAASTGFGRATFGAGPLTEVVLKVAARGFEPSAARSGRSA